MRKWENKEAEILQIRANNNNAITIWEYTRKMRTNAKTKNQPLKQKMVI